MSVLAILPLLVGQVPIDWLDREQFEGHIVELCSHGSRHWNEPGNAIALDYVESELQSFGYEVIRHDFGFFSGESQTSTNMYATRWGSFNPDEMYILGAHIDSKLPEAPTGGADDDASGCSLLLEVARIFSYLEPEISIRFVWFNAEEFGLLGSKSYVVNRINAADEPIWLGMIQYDMILYDRGNEPDADIQRNANSGRIAESLALAISVQGIAAAYSELPCQVSGNMCCTDSVSFEDHTAAISIRENRRQEIPTTNPHYHQPTDVPETYTEQDYDFGFEIVKMTTGAMFEKTNSIPRFRFDTWPAFIECMTDAECLDYDLNSNGITDLRDAATFFAYIAE